MDQGPLLEVEIADGKRLLERLAEEGVPVTAAGWLKESENGRWHLYIATPLIGADGGTRQAYRRIGEVIRKFPQPFWADEPVKAVEGSGPFAKAVQQLHQRPISPSTIRLGEGSFGGVSIDGAWIYPPLTAAVP